MENIKTRESLKFHFDAWLSRQREDAELMRECAATRPQHDTLPRMIHCISYDRCKKRWKNNRTLKTLKNKKYVLSMMKNVKSRGVETTCG